MQKNDINSKLVAACTEGSIDKVQQLISTGANPFLALPQTVQLTAGLNTEVVAHPFIAAIESGNLKLMQYFLNTIKCNPLMAIGERSYNNRVKHQTLKEKHDAVCAAIKHYQKTAGYLNFVDSLLAKAREKKKLDARVAKYQS